MLLAIVALLLPTAYAAEMPSYIKVCGRKDPNLGQCILDNINNLREKICHGMEDFDTPPLDPINIDKLVISEADNNKICINNVLVTGLCAYEAKVVANVVDIDNLNFNVDISFTSPVHLNGTCDVNVRMLVPIVTKAPIHLITDTVTSHINLKLKMTNKDGKVYIYASKVNTKININGYTLEHGFKDNDVNQLNEVINGLIGSNQQEFIDKITPQLEESFSKWIISIFNGIAKRYTYDEFLPDRE